VTFESVALQWRLQYRAQLNSSDGLIREDVNKKKFRRLSGPIKTGLDYTDSNKAAEYM